MDQKQFLEKVNGVVSKVLYDNSKVRGKHSEELAKYQRKIVLESVEKFLKKNKVLDGMF